MSLYVRFICLVYVREIDNSQISLCTLISLIVPTYTIPIVLFGYYLLMMYTISYSAFLIAIRSSYLYNYKVE